MIFLNFIKTNWVELYFYENSLLVVLIICSQQFDFSKFHKDKLSWIMTNDFSHFPKEFFLNSLIFLNFIKTNWVEPWPMISLISPEVSSDVCSVSGLLDIWGWHFLSFYHSSFFLAYHESISWIILLFDINVCRWRRILSKTLWIFWVWCPKDDRDNSRLFQVWPYLLRLQIPWSLPQMEPKNLWLLMLIELVFEFCSKTNTDFLIGLFWSFSHDYILQF